ncbi:MAG: alpha/beta hydrolase [Proteobacteria bacterium]|nr:alpha/beta hydrolase [Pseudomonadota bacterium]
MKTLLWIALALLTALLAWLAYTGNGRDALPAVGTAEPGYYRQEPAGTAHGTVVLLASLGRPVSDFNALAQSLVAAGWRTLAVESRGMGTWAGAGFFGPATLAGYADDVASALTHSRLPAHARVVVVGHAYGNRVARAFAVQHPARTAGVVLLAAGDKPHLPPEIEQGLKRAALSPLPWALREDAVRRTFFAPGHAVSADWQRGWSAWAALAQSRAVRATPTALIRDAGHAPVLVVQPAADVVAPVSQGTQLVAELGPRARLVVIPEAGHALLPEQPGAVAQAVLGFLRTLPQP